MAKTTKESIGSLQKEHQQLIAKYDGFCEECVHQIKHLLNTENIQLAVPIELRTKQWDSILNKIENSRFTIKKSITELQDLAGIRIILLFQRDVTRVIEIINSNFDVEKQYNTEEKLEDNQFGYSSVHIIAKFKPEWLKIPTLSHYTDTKAEIQIRTLSQHSWAEASKILQYKNEQNVPKKLRRSIGRISALLEIVDIEYERMLQERSMYKEEVKETSNQKEKELDVDMLAEILDSSLPEANKGELEPYSDLLAELKDLNIKTNFELVALIGVSLTTVIKQDQKRVDELMRDEDKSKDLYYADRLKKGVFFSHIGLVRMMLRNRFGSEKVNNVIKKVK